MKAQYFTLAQLGRVSEVEWYLRHPWPGWLVFLLVAGGAFFALYSYRDEQGLSFRLRLCLGTLRAILYAILILLLFEPAYAVEMTVKLRRTLLVLLDVSESMSIKDPRNRPEEVEEINLISGKARYEDLARGAAEPPGRPPATISRLDLAKGILQHPELQLFERLSEDYQVLYFCFGDRLEALSGEGSTFAETLRGLSPTAKATALGNSIEDAVSRYGGQTVAGVVLLTDGASNEGRDTVEVARRMKGQGIPLYPIALGLPRPPDVRLDDLIVQDVVLLNEEVSVRVQFQATGIARQKTELILRLDGEEKARTTVELSGSPQVEEIPLVPDKAGSFRLEVSVQPLPLEIESDNNSASQTIRVIDEKIHVLYLEGKPRWEYRYLRQVLLRDPRLEVKFIMAEGDQDLAKHDAHYLTKFPEDSAQAFQFDLIILGDVRLGPHLQPGDLDRIEDLVRKRGGSFLMICGHRHAPTDYHGTAIEKILPVHLRAGSLQPIEPTVHPVLTRDGQKSSMMRLEPSEEPNQALWRLVKPLDQLPPLSGPKPGAWVLASLSHLPERDVPYPLIAWHRYGTGKVLFVGTDQLWRLRFMRGDQYHARFWRQAIQFLTLSRLLGENKQVSIQSDRREYRTGETARLYAHLLNELYEPLEKPEYTVFLERTETAETEKTIKLEPLPGMPGLYQGLCVLHREGRYAIRTPPEDRESSHTAEFDVVNQPLEQMQPAMQQDTLKKMAELSGGKYITIRDLPALHKALGGEKRTTLLRKEKELWDSPFVFLVLLFCAGLEWLLRRNYDLT